MNQSDAPVSFKKKRGQRGKNPSAFFIEECRKLGLIFAPWNTVSFIVRKYR
jgi:hypothetical protein